MELSLAKDYLLYKKIYQRRLEQQDEFNANLAIELSEIINRLEILEVKAPPERGGSVKMLDNYSELIDVLKNKEGIL